jgi:hypothetical protein
MLYGRSAVPGFELARGRVPAIGNSHRAAHTESPFGKVEAVADDPANAVKRHPPDKLGINTALQDKVFDEPPHVVVRKGRGHSGFESETATQAAGDVVFTAPLPDFELARRADTAFAWVQAEHDFTQRQQVIFAGADGFDVESSHGGFLGWWSDRLHGQMSWSLLRVEQPHRTGRRPQTGQPVLNEADLKGMGRL